MKAELISRSVHQNSSFSLENHCYNSFLKKWHYHPELELVIIAKSTGTRFVGDSIEKFSPGEIVLLGQNLPHLWLNDKAYFAENSELRAHAHVVHFSENFAGGLFNIPEFSSIKHLFERARRGIKFEGPENEKITIRLQEMYKLEGFDKVMSLLEILHELSVCQHATLLSSAGFVDNFKSKQHNKLIVVYEYIMNNFKQEITLDKVAELANMNPSAFSRYFKSINKKTFTQYLNEVRIGYACKLLQEHRYNIAEVCFESGYNNISNFNRQFKSLKKMSPTAYVKMYAQLEYN
ncbi:AraC family transcriptional regulator [Catalinimonas sp. 4WD22]|uniref:AraC family transcriptional regulator n=1 Tax=Catalinimonas locisalis TaxID=3133978 RepID=UPI0031017B3C